MNDNFDNVPQGEPSEQINENNVQINENNIQPIPNYVPQYESVPPTPASGAAKTLGIISLITGILSIICCCSPYLAIACAVASLITGIIGCSKAGKDGKKGMAIAGIVLASIGIISFIVLIVFGALLVSSPELASSLDPIFEQAYGMSFEEYMETLGTIR